MFPQIRDAAAVSDYLSAVMELCSLRLSLFHSPPPSKQPRGTITALLILCIACDSVARSNSPPSDAHLLFARMLRQLRPLKAPDLKVTVATTKLDFRLGMCQPQ